MVVIDFAVSPSNGNYYALIQPHATDVLISGFYYHKQTVLNCRCWK
jgi:hypothetical protein